MFELIRAHIDKLLTRWMDRLSVYVAYTRQDMRAMIRANIDLQESVNKQIQGCQDELLEVKAMLATATQNTADIQLQEAVSLDRQIQEFQSLRSELSEVKAMLANRAPEVVKRKTLWKKI